MPFGIPSIGFAILGNEPLTFPDGRAFDAIEVARWLGADHIRFRLPLTGRIRFPNAWLDNTLARAKKCGMAVDLLFWIEADNAPRLGDTTTVSLAAYRIFVSQLALACKGKIRSVSVDNEPDAVGASATDYAARVAVAVNTWHDIDPNVIVVAGELRAEDSNAAWLDGWIPAQVATGVLPDAVSFHAYDGYRDRWNNGHYGPRAKAEWLDGQLVNRGQWAAKLRLTECGGPSAPSNQWTTMTEPLQSAIMLRTIAECPLYGVDSVTVYRLADQADGLEEQKFGLFRSDGGPKLAAYQFQKALASLRLSGVVTGADLGPDRIGRVKR